jgi:uncharacterized membrane protein YqaE (UPF0057 family)
MNLEFGKLIKNVASIKLGKGIFGKTATVLIILIVTFGFIAGVTHNIWVSILTLVLLTFIVVFIISKLVKLAENNPQSVILEGAEFVLHQQIVYASKGKPVIPISHVQFVTGAPIQLDAIEIDLSEKPDVPETATPEKIDNTEVKREDKKEAENDNR